MTDGPYFAGDESGGGGGVAPSSSSEIGAAVGFITEFNHNVAIFNAAALLILDTAMANAHLAKTATDNQQTIDGNRKDIEALKSTVSDLSASMNHTNPGDGGISSDIASFLQRWLGD